MAMENLHGFQRLNGVAPLSRGALQLFAADSK